MRKFLTPFLLLFIIICTVVKTAEAQDPTANAGAYIDAINNAETNMNKAYMAYISAAAHSSRKRKVEKMRDLAVENIITCQTAITYLSPYNGDDSFRQSSLKYVQLCYKIFNDDYAHIVNMEEIADRSFDEMQAYLLLQEATNDTLKAANERMTNAVNSFAKKYNINLISEKSELGDKMELTGKLSKYRDKVYLLFFKCNWEDNQLTEAINQKNVTKIEQVRSAMGKYAIEGLAILDTLQAYENDSSLAGACKQALTFYKGEAETQTPQLTDFFLKEENFNKLKNTFDAKSADKRTQQDVDAYNKAVNDMNDGVNSYNQINNDLNNGRNEVNKNWADTDRQFLDTHTPYYK